MFSNSNFHTLANGDRRHNYQILKEKSCFVIDLDGVVYKGKQMIFGASDAIKKFRAIGKQITFLTNNSGSSIDSIVRKLQSFEIDCDRQEIISAAQASAYFIAQSQIDNGEGIFVIGTDALKAEIREHGLKLADPDHCGVVLVGFDPQFDLAAINMALKAIARGARFIICNRDANFPIEDGALMAGCGAMVGAIEAATGIKPEFEIGKPNRMILDILIERLKIPATDCLIIGDSLASDILMANNASIPSVWISETLAPFNLPLNSPKPSLCMRSLAEISQCIPKCISE